MLRVPARLVASTSPVHEYHEKLLRTRRDREHYEEKLFECLMWLDQELPSFEQELISFVFLRQVFQTNFAIRDFISLLCVCKTLSTHFDQRRRFE